MTILARDAVSFDGVSSDGYSSGARSTVGSGARGNGGDITIKSGTLSVTDGAVVTASTFGRGDAGNVFVQATDSVSLANSDIFSNLE